MTCGTSLRPRSSGRRMCVRHQVPSVCIHVLKCFTPTSSVLTPTEAYRLNAWHCVDTFVYFSHHLVTIPPPGWINAAHRNGVPVRTFAGDVHGCCALGPTLAWTTA